MNSIDRLIEGVGKIKKSLVIFLLFSNLLFASSNGGALAIDSTPSSQAQGSQSSRPSQVTSRTYSKLAINDDEKPTSDEEMTLKLDNSGRFFAERMIVKFKDNVSDDIKRKIAKENKFKFIREDLDLLGAKEIRVDENLRDIIYDRLKNDPNIEYIEKEGVVRPTALPIECGDPNDPLYCEGNQWGLNSINAKAGWRITRGSPLGTVVAVVDTGVDYNHFDIRDKVIKGYNVTVGPTSPDYNNPMDDQGHGTFIAGIIGASTNNASYMAGVDWNSKILAIKALYGNGITPLSMVADGINVAANEFASLNVKVINASVSTYDESNALRLAVQNAQNKGITVVAGAAHPADSSSNCFIGFPAAYPGVVSVVAVDQANQRVSGCIQTDHNGSSYQGVQISAPGKDLNSLNLGGGTTFYGPANTSFAAPFVSGVVSILSSCSSTPVSDLLNGATDLGPPGRDSEYGYGKVNLWKALVQTCASPLGDVDCNGAIDSLDALHILKYVAGLEYGNYDVCPVNTSYGDVDRDGDIDAVDALFVLQYSAGIRSRQTQSLISPNIDSDGDGITNQQETQYSCMNPNVSDATANPDNDGVMVAIPGPDINISMDNSSEIILGTNPCVSDTDRDGYSDGAEIFIGTKPDKACITSDDDIDMTKLTYPSKTWPADLNAKDSSSRNRINMLDLSSFVGIPRVYQASWGSPSYDMRWDVVPGTGAVQGNTINISDLQSVALGTASMFNGQRMYGGPVCTP